MQASVIEPVDLFHRDGATALRTAIDTSPSLARALLDTRLTPVEQIWSTADIRVVLCDVGAIITALPPSRWLDLIDQVTEVLGVPPGTVHQAVLDLEPSIATARKPTTGPPQPRLTPPYENHHRTGHTGQPPNGTPPNLHHSR